VIVTHNMQQATRVSDLTGFFNVTNMADYEGKVGCLEEFGDTERIFNSPAQQATQDYVSGRFG
jgi:phosphate transport system ATP-binding protein